MKILLYSALMNGETEKIYGLIGVAASENNISICQTVADLAHELRQPRVGPIITVAMTATAQELISLLQIKDLLHDTRLFLVLPDRNADTVAKGHRLHPRFITYKDSDLMDSANVLKKILKNANKEEFGPYAADTN